MNFVVFWRQAQAHASPVSEKYVSIPASDIITRFNLIRNLLRSFQAVPDLVRISAAF